MSHPLAGRPQSEEHLRNRVASIAATQAAWTPEWRAEVARRNRVAHLGQRPWWTDGQRTPSGPRRTADERRALRAAQARSRRSRNPDRRLHESVSAMVRQSLRSGKAGRSWEALVGYGLSDLRARLESRFTPGMTWANYGAWHIDHVVPRVAFTFASERDPGFRACWAISNLQPLWAADNLSKGATH